jgi:hypothetical protein
VAPKVAFAIIGDPRAGDEVVHATADVDRGDLHVAVVGEGGGDIDVGRGEAEDQELKTADEGGFDGEDGREPGNGKGRHGAQFAKRGCRAFGGGST